MIFNYFNTSRSQDICRLIKNVTIVQTFFMQPIPARGCFDPKIVLLVQGVSSIIPTGPGYDLKQIREYLGIFPKCRAGNVMCFFNVDTLDFLTPLITMFVG